MMPADQAVEELIQKYYKLVFHTIYGMTGNWEESQDLTQDTFHQALKAIDAARAVSGEQFREKAWLLRIALNTVRMQRRRRNLFRFIPFSGMQTGRQTEKAFEGEAGGETLNERAAAVQPAGYGAGEAIDPAELVAERDLIQRTMARLPATLRECLILAIIGNFSTNEIAQMLDLQEAAVRQRLVRARKQFQQMYTLENGEQVGDNEIPATMPEKASRHTDFDERFDCRSEQASEDGQHSLLGTQPLISRRNYAEGLS
ncbi:MAG: RNA polymerase sigma factor [Ktedonobacteraceae bacterium]